MIDITKEQLADVLQACRSLETVNLAFSGDLPPETIIELLLNNKVNLSGIIGQLDKQFLSICMAAVQQNGYALKYIKNQTPEICLAAVKQNGWALKYVREQTPEIYMAAVKRDGYALHFIKEQTPDICLAAVQRNGQALQHVKKQTPEICMAAVQQDCHALNLVRDPAIKWEIERALAL
jgi:hypothetical protein